jgi:hypothetical protein
MPGTLESARLSPLRRTIGNDLVTTLAKLNDSPWFLLMRAEVVAFPATFWYNL